MKRLLVGLMGLVTLQSACGSQIGAENGGRSAVSTTDPSNSSVAANPTTVSSVADVTYPTPIPADGSGVPFRDLLIAAAPMALAQVPMSVQEAFALMRSARIVGAYFRTGESVESAKVEYAFITDESDLSGARTYPAYVITGGTSECPNYGPTGPPNFTCTSWAVIDATAKEIVHLGESQLVDESADTIVEG